MGYFFPRAFSISLLFLFFTKLFSQLAPSDFIIPDGVSAADFVSNCIIIKLLPETKAQKVNNQIQIPDLANQMDAIKARIVRQKFPLIQAPHQKLNAFGQQLIDLTMIYEVHFDSSMHIADAINILLGSGKLEYAQPIYIIKPLSYTPSDPLLSNQYHLNNIRAYDAWDICQGDSNVLVGICDWGNDIDHPDLLNNVKYNYYDPIDGIDNDNDGYTDNYRGWDLGDNDNNPQGFITHGCFVSGLSSATTNNGTGIAGTGFLCKYLPIKICDSNNYSTRSYEGIIYAVEHGCSIVNCSWGSPYYTGPYGQDVINYATNNRNALVIAACGNSNNIIPFYPASYDNVLSIAATNQTDAKWGGSSYGYYVDLSAPGENVWSTYDGGTYGPSSGTSFSAPIVAGCAALLKSKFPALSGVQIGEKLKVSADIIDTLPANINYKNLLGTGRINIFRALHDSLTPSIHCFQKQIIDKNQDGVFNALDTLIISGDFINYLAPSSPQLKVQLSIITNNCTMLDSIYQLGSMPSSGITSNQSHPFKALIKPGIANNEIIMFRLTFQDTNYRGTEVFQISVNPNYIILDTNNIAVSFTNQGMIGFDKGNTLQGKGFTYKDGPSLLASGGLMLGISNTRVSDVVYKSPTSYDNDFLSKKAFHYVASPSFGDVEIQGEFNDSLAGNQQINVHVKQRIFAWNENSARDFLVITFNIINKNPQPINGLYCGLYLDWDIGIPNKNQIGFDAINKLGYCFPVEGGTYTGISSLSQTPWQYYAFDNDGTFGSIDIMDNDGFTTTEKFTALKTSRLEAGLSTGGNNVSHLYSNGPYLIGVGDSIESVFVLLAGETLFELQQSLSQAHQYFYQSGINITDTTNSEQLILYQNYPNPFSGSTLITFFLPVSTHISLQISDITGTAQQDIFDGYLKQGIHEFGVSNLKQGIYIYTLTTPEKISQRKMCVIY